MKCPKCGYNSFEYHDSCKKCSNDLQGYKETFGIKSIVLPAEVRSVMAASLMAEETSAPPQEEEVQAATDMFSFDLPDDELEPTAADANSDNPFDFGDESAGSEGNEQQGFGEFSFDDEQKSPQTKAEEDAFESLLESTSMENDDSAAASQASAAPAATAGSPGEFDLDNFSWDDTPTAVAADGATKTDDDFNSLFGELDDANKK
ncbi:MAG TPA: hypothetical protein VGJ93_05445 [Desulfuromonadaceae bacterium]|jgi:predicted  nucleic acid-binding Zn-ribbon protein